MLKDFHICNPFCDCLLKNKKGEVVTLTVIAVACIVMGFLFRPMMDKVLPMFGNNQKIISSKVVESKPIWMKNPDGTSTMVQTTSTTIDNSAEPVKFVFAETGQLGLYFSYTGQMYTLSVHPNIGFSW